MADDITELLKLILDAVRRDISAQEKIFQSLDENLVDTNKGIISVLKSFGFSSQKLAPLYKVLKQQSSYTKSVSELEKWLIKNSGLIPPKSIEALEKTAKQLENASKSLGSTVNGVYRLKNDIALARKQVEDLARIINAHPSSLLLTGGNNQGVIVPQLPSLRHKGNLSPYNYGTHLTAYTQGGIRPYPRGNYNNPNNEIVRNFMWEALYKAAWEWYNSHRPNSIGGGSNPKLIGGPVAGSHYGSRVGLGHGDKAHYGSKVVLDPDGNVIYMDNDEIKGREANKPKVSNWMIPLGGSTDSTQQGTKNPTQRAEVDKEQDRFIKKLLRGMRGLPLFNQVNKLATEALRYGMLRWASNKPRWVQKATLGAVGLEVPETVTKLGGSAFGTASGLLLSQFLTNRYSNIKTFLRRARIGSQLLGGGASPAKRLDLIKKVFAAGRFGTVAKSLTGGALGLLGSLAIDPLAQWGENGIMHSGMGMGAKRASVTGVHTLSGVAQGALFGAVFGPVGAAIGGTLGGIYGLIKGLGKDVKDIKDKDDKPLWDRIVSTVTGQESDPSTSPSSPRKIATRNSALKDVILENFKNRVASGDVKNFRSVMTTLYPQAQAEAMTEGSGYYEKIKPMKYFGVQYQKGGNKFSNDIMKTRTGVLEILQSVASQSPYLQSIGMQISSGTSSATSLHDPKGGHGKGGGIDIVGGDPVRVAAEFNKLSGGLMKAVAEGDHVDLKITKEGYKFLDEINQRNQEYVRELQKAANTTVNVNKDKDDPTGMGEATKKIIGAK